MSAHSRTWGVWVFVLALSAGCGGKSQVEGGGQESSGAGASNGGATSMAGASNVAGAGSAGGPSAGCPVAPPQSGKPCKNEGGGYCSYPIDKCSYLNFECSKGLWRPAPQSGGAAYDCNSFYPPNAPRDGDSCECLGKLDCSYADCADRGQIHAVCDNTTWHVKDSACAKQPCGPLYCEPGTVCVVRTGANPTQFECAKNPCERGPTDCDCAASLCNGGQCKIDVGAVACF